MNLDDLRSVQSAERRADSLQSLPDDFYRNVAEYIESLREERAHAAERADDPFGSEEVRQLTDEIETAEEVAEAIYERRVGKVVKRASLAAAGMPADEEGLTAEEQDLFADLVSQIEAHRSAVLAAFAGENDAGENDESATETTAERPAKTDPTPEPTDGVGSAPATGEERAGNPASESEPERSDPDPAEMAEDDVASAVAENAPDFGDDSGFDAGDAMGSGGGDSLDEPREREPMPTETDGGAVTEPPAEPGPDGHESTGAPGVNDSTDRKTVRITREVGEIFGVDERTYHLGEEDVVTLPEENADPLIERDAAQEL